MDVLDRAEIQLLVNNIKHTQSVTDEECVVAFSLCGDRLGDLGDIALPRTFIRDYDLVEQAAEVGRLHSTFHMLERFFP